MQHPPGTGHPAVLVRYHADLALPRVDEDRVPPVLEHGAADGRRSGQRGLGHLREAGRDCEVIDAHGFQLLPESRDLEVLRFDGVLQGQHLGLDGQRAHGAGLLVQRVDLGAKAGVRLCGLPEALAQLLVLGLEAVVVSLELSDNHGLAGALGFGSPIDYCGSIRSRLFRQGDDLVYEIRRRLLLSDRRGLRHQDAWVGLQAMGHDIGLHHALPCLSGRHLLMGIGGQHDGHPFENGGHDPEILREGQVDHALRVPLRAQVLHPLVGGLLPLPDLAGRGVGAPALAAALMLHRRPPPRLRRMPCSRCPRACDNPST